MIAASPTYCFRQLIRRHPCKDMVWDAAVATQVGPSRICVFTTTLAGVLPELAMVTPILTKADSGVTSGVVI